MLNRELLCQYVGVQMQLIIILVLVFVIIQLHQKLLVPQQEYFLLKCVAAAQVFFIQNMFFYVCSASVHVCSLAFGLMEDMIKAR